MAEAGASHQPQSAEFTAQPTAAAVTMTFRAQNSLPPKRQLPDSADPQLLRGLSGPDAVSLRSSVPRTPFPSTDDLQAAASIPAAAPASKKKEAQRHGGQQGMGAMEAGAAVVHAVSSRGLVSVRVERGGDAGGAASVGSGSTGERSCCVLHDPLCCVSLFMVGLSLI